jgi:outer membrane receptor protein involved in Fe transport
VSVVHTQRLGTATGEEGQYSLQLPAGERELTFRFVGYRTATRTVEVEAGETVTLDVQMQLDVLGLDDMVVTATRNPIESIESTVTINSLSAEEIESQQTYTVTDLIQNVPGVMAVSDRGYTRSEIWVRGFPEGENLIQYTTRLLDGLPFFVTTATPPDAAFKSDIGIERVEVVRGGAATLYGRSAAAGVVNVISKTGGGELSGKVRLSGGQYGLYRGDFTVGGPIGDQWAFQATGLGLTDNGIRREAFDDEILQLRANVTRFLGDEGYFRLYGMYLNAKASNNVDVPLSTSSLEFVDGYDNRFSWASVSDFADVEYPRAINNQGGSVMEDIENLERGDGSLGGHLGFRLNYEFSEQFSIENKFRWNRIRYDNGSMFSSGFAPTSALNQSFGLPPQTPWVQVFNDNQPAHEVPGRGEFGALLIRAYGPSTINDFANDLQLTTNFDVGQTSHDVTLGGYLGHSRADLEILGDLFVTDLTPEEPRIISPRVPNVGPIFPDGPLQKQVIFRFADEDVTNWAIYGGDRIEVSDRLRIDFGARWDQSHLNLSEQKKVTYNNPDNPNDPLNGTAYPSEETVERDVVIGDWSATLGANLSVSEETAVYANLNRAFRAPNEDVFTPVRRNPSGNFTQPEPEEQETIYGAEAGVKSSFLNGQVGLNAASFFTHISDRLTQGFSEEGGAFAYVTTSAGTIQILGAETSIRAAPRAVDGLRLMLSGTWQNTEYTEFEDFILSQDVTLPQDELPSECRVESSTILCDATGNELLRIPEFMFSADVSYNREYFGGGLQGNFRGSAPGDELNRTEIPSNFLLSGNLYARLPLGGNQGALRFFVRGTNLLDSNNPQWFLDVENIALSVEEGDPIAAGVPYLPRRITGGVTYSF